MSSADLYKTFGYVPTRKTARGIKSMRVSDEAYNGLKHLARQHGYTRGGLGNVSEFLEALGQGIFTLTISVEDAEVTP